MKGIIDLDLTVYSVGSACDGRHYMYRGQRYDNKTSLNKQLKLDGAEDFSVPLQKDPEPWEKCKTSVVSYVEDIMARSGCIEFSGWISGKSNFRYRLATILPYKGNRDDIEKPYHYDNIRQFLVDVYDAKVSVDKEADDEIGLEHNPEETVIITVDKDLDCIPGLHFNYQKDTCHWISEIQAKRNFYKQCLTGDDTDNILGLYGVGKASKLLKNVDQMDNEEEMYTYVYSEYKKRFGAYSEKFLKENAQLLWIQQNDTNLIMERL